MHRDLLYRAITQYVQLSETDRQRIPSLFSVVQLEKGSFVLREGEICRQLGIITKGIVRYFIDTDGEDRTYNFAKEGDFVCNYESMIRKSPSVKHIQAIEPLEMFVISYDNLQVFYRDISEGERFGRLHLEKVYTDTIRQLVSQYTESAEMRYKKFIEKYPDLQQRLAQYYIASYVGIKPQSLSRIRKRLTSSIA